MAQTSLNSTGVASSGALSLQSNGTTEAIGISTGQVATLAQNPILTSGTANGLAFLNASKVLTTGSALTFDGNALSIGTGSAQSVSTINGGSTGGAIRGQRAGANQWFLGDTAAALGSGTGLINFLYNNDPFIWYSNGSEKMRLDSSGNLGLGVTPSAWFTSNSLKAIQLGGGSLVSYTNNQVWLASNYYLNSSGQDTYVGTGAANRLIMDGAYKFFTAPSGTAGNAITFTQAMTLDSSGNLLLNTTSQNGAGKFSVKYSGSSEQGINIRDTDNASGSAYMVFGSSTGTTYGTITNNSNTGVLYNVTSDQRLKENIIDAPEFGSVIDSIQVRSYNWKSNGSHQRAGFIAQELVTVAPEAVHQPADTDEMMAVDYSKLVPMLVKEIQSLRQRVAQLESN